MKAEIEMNWKMMVQKLFNKFGFEIHKIKDGKEYTLNIPFGYSTYSPWFENWFQEMYSKIKGYTLVKEDRCYIIHKFCQYSLHINGDFAECVVYKRRDCIFNCSHIGGIFHI